MRENFVSILVVNIIGKLKWMHRFMKAVAGNLADEMAVKAANGTDFDLKEVFGKFRQVLKSTVRPDWISLRVVPLNRP